MAIKKHVSEEEIHKPSVMQVVEVVDENENLIDANPSGASVLSSSDHSDNSYESETKDALTEKFKEEGHVNDVRSSLSWKNTELKSEEPGKHSDEVMAELFGDKDTAFGAEITSHTKKKNPMMFIMWVIAGVAAAILVGGSFFAIAKKSTKTVSFVPTPTIAPEPTAMPTPAPVNKLDFTIKVLNGGGVKGAAGKMKTFLEEKGYKVSETGNTSDFTHPQTEIYVKGGKENLLLSLASDLKESYSLGTSAAALEDAASTDAQIIVGKE
jgi:hypothetical protein